MTDAVHISIRITRLEDRDGFTADAERAEPWWATADGYGSAPEIAAMNAVRALPPISSAEYVAIES